MAFCCYVPGGGFQQFHPGVGKRIPTDGYVSWGMHYTSIGRPVMDQTRVGLWFQDEMTHEISGLGAGGGSTHIVQGKQLVDDSFTPLRTNGVGNAGFPAIPVIPGVHRRLGDHLDQRVPGRRDVVSHVGTHAPARQGDDVPPHVSGWPGRGPAERAGTTISTGSSSTSSRSRSRSRPAAR